MDPYELLTRQIAQNSLPLLMRQRPKVVDVRDVHHVPRELLELTVRHRLRRMCVPERRDLKALLGIEREIPAQVIDVDRVRRVELRKVVPDDLQRLHRVRPWFAIPLTKDGEHRRFVEHERNMVISF